MFAEKDYRYPYLGGDFTQDDEDLLSESWINKSYEIDSRFQPAGTAGLRGPMGYGDRPTRKGMPELLAVLKRVLATDWEGSAFDILLDTTGCVVVRFELATVESRDGLAAYMNVLLKSNPLVIPFLMSRVPEVTATPPIPPHLQRRACTDSHPATLQQCSGLRRAWCGRCKGWWRRRSQYWNKERMSGQVDFTMRPPWVPNRAMGKVFSQMHPEYLETGAVSVAENDKEREPEQGG